MATITPYPTGETRERRHRQSTIRDCSQNPGPFWLVWLLESAAKRLGT